MNKLPPEFDGYNSNIEVPPGKYVGPKESDIKWSKIPRPIFFILGFVLCYILYHI